MCSRPNEFPRATSPREDRLLLLDQAIRILDPYYLTEAAWQHVGAQLAGERAIVLGEGILGRALDRPEFRRDGLRHLWETCHELRYGNWLNAAALEAFFGLTANVLAWSLRPALPPTLLERARAAAQEQAGMEVYR